MKIKKMLAILAALSVLGTTGLTVGAEDTVTTTESATEASTTAETEVETTAVETTAEIESETETTVKTDVTEETAATEENQIVGKQTINEGDVRTFSGTLSYANGKNRPILNLDTPIEATVGGVDETITYVRLNEESLTYVDGARLTVTGTVDLTAFAGTGQNVVFLSNNTITENNVTTTVITAETTTTTTTTTSEADLEAAKKSLYDKFIAAYGKPDSVNYGDFNHDGKLDAYCTYYSEGVGVTTYLVTDDAIVNAGGVPVDYMGITTFTYFECNGYQFRANFRSRVVAAYAVGSLTIDRIESDGTLTTVDFATDVLGDDYGVGNTPHYLQDLTSSQVGDIASYFVSNGDSITIKRYFYDEGRSISSTDYVYDAANNTFVTGGSTSTTPDEEMTTIKIYDNEPVTLSGTVSYEKDMTNFWHGILTLDKPVKVIYMDSMSGMVEPGTTEVIDSVQISFNSTVSIPEGAHITVTGRAMHSHTAHHLRSLVLMDCTYQLDGKTDNGSASNAPATKGTSSTPKTGDTTTVPAVAVGLTLTAAGVVAFISKRKK